MSTEKLRIAMFGHKRIPSREGGIEVVVEKLSTAMVRRGHSVTCFNRAGKHVSGKEFGSKSVKEWQGVKIRKVLTLDFKGLAAMSASVSAALLAAFGRYDVVHVHAEGPSFMCWLPKLLRKRVIVTVHGLDHMRAKWGRFASWYLMQGEKNAVKYADEIIVLSEGVRDYFLNTYGRKTVFIPNGVERPKILPADIITEKYGLTKDSYVLFLGRIVPEKGLRYLISAYKELNTDKKLVIAGGSSDSQGFMDELKEMSENDDRILFTGFVQGKELHELYSNAYVYTLPSDLEGMPLSLLEAMSYGNCCVTSDISECTEVVEDKAVVFKKSDPEDLREKLQMLLDDPHTVASLQRTSADFICAKYNWEDVTDKTLQLYTKQRS